jgi:threonine dehydrogenase-like Zn-dependent dehydrogenase
VQALLAQPGIGRSTRVGAFEDAAPPPGGIVVRVLEVGVCGTDREIAHGLFGVAPDGERELVLGHEVVGVVERDGPGFTRGDLVTATVRRSCGACSPCAAGAPEACRTGAYSERGITRLHGFARERLLEDPAQLVRVPASLGRHGVLAEPTSICERGLRLARLVGGRQPWEVERALVIGAGAIGVLSTLLLRLDGIEVWTAALQPRESAAAGLVAAVGARYCALGATTLAEVREGVGGFDLVVEATGDAQVMVEALALLRRNGVACLLGLDGRPGTVTLDARSIGIDAVLENRAVFGSVNAHRVDWEAAVADLTAIAARWPEQLERLVGLRVPLDRYEEAFAFRGVKATLLLDAL